MKKFFLWFVLLVGLYLTSCSGSTNKEPQKDSAKTENTKSDSIEIIKNPDENQDGEEEQKESEGENDTPLTPQEP